MRSRGDFAYAFSTDFKLIKKPGKEDEEIKAAAVIWVLRKQDDRWKIFR